MNVGDLLGHQGVNKAGIIIKKRLDSHGEWFIIVMWPDETREHPVADPWLKILSRR